MLFNGRRGRRGRRRRGHHERFLLVDDIAIFGMVEQFLPRTTALFEKTQNGLEQCDEVPHKAKVDAEPHFHAREIEGEFREHRERREN